MSTTALKEMEPKLAGASFGKKRSLRTVHGTAKMQVAWSLYRAAHVPKRRRVCLREQGSVSAFAIFVMIPLLLVGLTVTVDLGNFFSVREELRGVVDREALAALRERLSTAALEARMRDRLKVFEPVVDVKSLQIQSNDGKLHVEVGAGFHSYLAEFLLTMAGKQDGWTIPFTSVAAVRKVTSSTLAIVDRIVADPNQDCSDDGLVKTQEFIGALSRGFQRSGAARMTLGVLPGVDTDVQLVKPLSGAAPAPLCGEEQWRVQGVNKPAPPPVNILFDLGTLLSSGFFSPNTDRHVLLLVLRQERSGKLYMSEIIQHIGGLVERMNVRLSLIVVRVDPSDLSPTGLDSLANSRLLNYREVSVESVNLSDKELITAVIGEIAERIVISE